MDHKSTRSVAAVGRRQPMRGNSTHLHDLLNNLELERPSQTSSLCVIKMVRTPVLRREWYGFAFGFLVKQFSRRTGMALANELAVRDHGAPALSMQTIYAFTSRKLRETDIASRFPLAFGSPSQTYRPIRSEGPPRFFVLPAARPNHQAPPATPG